MNICIARRPVCDRNRRPRGYQLLFWPGIDQLFEHAAQEDIAPSSLVDHFMVPEMRKVIGDKRAFITLDHYLLETGSATRFRSSLVTADLGDDVQPTQDVLSTCRVLKSRRFDIAVPAEIGTDPDNPLARFASIFKVDFAATPVQEIETYSRIAEESSARLWATNLNTNNEFEAAVSYGYSLFQGDFLNLPETTLDSKAISDVIACICLLYEVNTPEPDMFRIAETVSASQTLSSSILQIVNSAAYGLTREVTSVRLAVSMMGLDDVTRWVTSTTVSSFAANQASVLLHTSLVRAKLIELMSQEAKMNNLPSELFMLGMSSAFVPLMRGRKDDVADAFALSKRARAALSGTPGPLADLLKLAIAYEHGKWNQVDALAGKLNLSKEKLSTVYAEAIKWSNGVAL